MAGHVTIHVFAGTPRLGLWCPTCLLPSGVEVELFAVTLDGVRTLGTARRCQDCLKPLIQEQQP